MRILALALALLLAGCDGAPQPPSPAQLGADSPEQVAERLPGSWLREFTLDGRHARHLLVLQADGHFQERVRVEDASGAVTTFRHEGSWLYDGTNLKRRYTLINGKPPSRLNVPFVTFQITFVSRNEFTGTDHIHGNRVSYHRVAPETP
jgi:hypothetical protein